jgi:glycosyltransferase involved in cell wall biosynthesis
MAEHGAWDVMDVAPDQLSSLPERLVSASLVLLDSIWLTEAHAAGIALLLARCPRVGVMLHSFPSLISATESGSPPLTRPSRFELQLIVALALVVVPGRHYADLLADSGAKILVAEPGIDAGWRAAPRHRSGPCRLVSVGAVTPRKGFLDVAGALEARAPTDYHWTVVGSLDVDPGYAERLVVHARRLGEVVLAGQQPPSEVQRIVRSSDLLLMPSYDENQPLVLVEAMAASVPAIAYAAGAARHMLQHGREGLIAPIGDQRAFSEHLDRVLDDEALRHSMALECWKRQHTIPSWSTAAQALRQALRAEAEPAHV